MESQFCQLDTVLQGLMRRYKERVPDVVRVVKMMIKEAMISSMEDIENDHVAFRTMGVEHLGIRSMEKIFLHYGYQKRDSYYFEQKKLKACWYAPPKDYYPRVFLSELCVDKLSRPVREKILSYTSQIKSDPLDSIDLDNGEEVDEFLHRPLWRAPSYNDYRILLDESEYAAWVIYNRYYLNHFTVSVHNLPEPYCDLEAYNEMLLSYGFKLNDSNGYIKISKDGLLRQSSTVSELVDAVFVDEYGNQEIRQISGSYVEFAERLPLEKYKHLEVLERRHRRDGFEVGNADKIFESTYTNQIGK